jgi:hypothetical protein
MKFSFYPLMDLLPVSRYDSFLKNIPVSEKEGNHETAQSFDQIYSDAFACRHHHAYLFSFYGD